MHADADFIAHARMDVPRLLDALDAAMPVVEAALAWRDEDYDGAAAEVALGDAVDRYREALG